MKRPFNRRSFRLRQADVFWISLELVVGIDGAVILAEAITLSRPTAHTAATLAVVPVPNVTAGAFVPTVHEFPAITARRRAFEVNGIKFLLEESK